MYLNEEILRRRRRRSQISSKWENREERGVAMISHEAAPGERISIDEGIVDD